MPRGLLFRRCSVLLSAGAFLIVLFAQTSAMAADVSTLFQQARSTAAQLNKDASTLESYTRSNVTWRSHAAQITNIKEHINTSGSILSQLHDLRESAEPWHLKAIDSITPMLEELASNTESAINHLNSKPALLKNPTYKQYLQSNAQMANELSSVIGNIVDYDNTKTKMEKLEAKLGEK